MTWIDLSQWMAKLYHPLQPGHRQQIRDRASQQKRQMTIQSVQKTTKKKQVFFGTSLNDVLLWGMFVVLVPNIYYII